MKTCMISLILISIAGTLFAQNTNSDEWINSTGYITEINRNVHARSIRSHAITSYLNQEGDTTTGLLDITFNFFVQEGDSIPVYYKKSQPTILYTFLGRVTEDYGLYLLIGIGVIISLFRFVKIRKSAKKAK